MANPFEGSFFGARALFLVNSVEIGFAGGVSGEETIDYEPVDVLGLLEVREYVPVAYRASLNAQIFRIVGNSLKKQNIMPKEDDILTSGDLSCAIQDKLTKQTIALFQQCKCSGHTWDTTARGITSENTTWVCIRVKDESEV